jgi:hypothetical protein
LLEMPQEPHLAHGMNAVRYAGRSRCGTLGTVRNCAGKDWG